MENLYIGKALNVIIKKKEKMIHKHRIWDKVNKCYVLNPYIVFPDNNGFYWKHNVDLRHLPLRSDLEADLEMWSTTFDKNKKEIYEGDILEGEDSFYGKFRAPVIFTNCRFTIDRFKAIQVKNPENWDKNYDGVKTEGFMVHWNPTGYHTIETGFKDNIYEIVSNIHENPEPIENNEKVEV